MPNHVLSWVFFHKPTLVSFVLLLFLVSYEFNFSTGVQCKNCWGDESPPSRDQPEFPQGGVSSSNFNYSPINRLTVIISHRPRWRCQMSCSVWPTVQPIKTKREFEKLETVNVWQFLLKWLKWLFDYQKSCWLIFHRLTDRLIVAALLHNNTIFVDAGLLGNSLNQQNYILPVQLVVQIVYSVDR